MGGLAAAFFVAFSKSFWDSAIEAEVYALSSLIIAFVIWLAFRWWDRIGTPGNDKLLVLICYVLAVSTGIHLATILVAPGLLLLLLLIRPRALLNGRFWGSAVILGFFLGLVVMNEVGDWGIPAGLFFLMFAAIVAFRPEPDKLVRNTWPRVGEAIVAGFTVQLFS